ncbi:Por secretion system C-terminal sorting domain-containing protein [Candidatus Kryptobacter tengchongensis]|uniref:Por secretion system C-terminal sorting domain-containing protein n=1 Tax=Candidatus Chryseopegocella kryptomonas TaxID=1633643 RepID=A0A0P1P2R1_9BACT|nr:T9SS type A sorting domain-containing protein [Candidatus Chrysopegis kryptomonas]CUT05440.1 Por secretion system C-terminal sorting domain-containing protein [Candidatus Chrysopegis kryptomonas]CUU10246.1 Por secretion system C-terminal sorting domain-containing protein [Candidatus Kryptobacter tengchongensis]
MRRLELFLGVIFYFLCTSFTCAHDQYVHQYICVEAYKLLKLTLGGDFPEMLEYLGGLGSANVAWDPYTEKRYITTGAWVEDEMDAVYGYSKDYPPVITGAPGVIGYIILRFFPKDPFVSSTHFWDADNGDNLKTDLEGTVGGLYFKFTVPNAYQKMQAYAFGREGVTVVFSRSCRIATLYDGLVPVLGLRFRYSSLGWLYKTGNIYVEKYLGIGGEWEDVGDSITIDPRSRFLKSIVYEILGRMCHLLGDMSVPAHAHRDAHGSDDDGIRMDSYEEWMKSYYTFWDAQKVYEQFGGFLNLYQSRNPLHFLMYTTQQIADHFGSNGPYEGDGNNVIGGDPLPEEIKYLNQVNLSSLGEPTTMNGPFDVVRLRNIRDKTFPQAIRAVAGLLYWFAKEAGLQFESILPLSVTISGPSVAPCATGTWYANVSGGVPGYSYQWYQMYCNNDAGAVSTISTSTTSNKVEPLRPPCEWTPVGTNSPTLQLYWCGGSGYLRVDVTDALGNSASAQYYVQGAGGGEPVPNLQDGHKIELAKPLPVEFSIRSYPNPFNPSATISYELPTDGFVRLSVFDVLGREVEVLVNEIKPAGFYDVSFDASNLPSGVYFARISVVSNEGKSFVQTIKMVLTK